MMEDVHNLILQRNAYETTPFVTVHASNVSLRKQSYNTQLCCERLETERNDREKLLDQLKIDLRGKGPSKIEIKQRDTIEKLQEQLSEKNRLSQELSKQLDLNRFQEKTIESLRGEVSRQEGIILKITDEMQDAVTNRKLAEKQYIGLKDNIRRLQEENDSLSKTSDELVNRIMSEKEKSAEEMNKMIDIIQQQKDKIEMLESVNKTGKWMKWGSTKDTPTEPPSSQISERKFGVTGSIAPTVIKARIRAHQSQATCLRYDSSGSDLVATASDDATVKIWHTGTGKLQKTLRGGSGHIMLGIDICGEIAAGGGTDKTCRIWNTRTERMIHQLVGHGHKITCARLLNGGKEVLTASADRSIKVWDIARHTYRQTTTLRHSSTVNCLDIPSESESMIVVSGHFDGGLRFWDIREKKRTTAEVRCCHDGGCTSVQFNPSNSWEILTAGRDSTVRLLDARTLQELYSFYHTDFSIDLNNAACAISPNGE